MAGVRCCEHVGYVYVQELGRLCGWTWIGVLDDVNHSNGVPAYESLGCGKGGTDVHNGVLGVLSPCLSEFIYGGVCVRPWSHVFPRTYGLVGLFRPFWLLSCLTGIFRLPVWYLHK